MNDLLRFYGKDLQDIDFEVWLEQKPEILRPIAIKWFNNLMNCGAGINDIFHDNYPIVCVENAPFAYVNVYSQHVNLGFFYGADIPDPLGLMEGSGKRMRHIKLKPEHHYPEEQLHTLIQHSYFDIKERLLLS